jgi:hypothetical protein
MQTMSWLQMILLFVRKFFGNQKLQVIQKYSKLEMMHIRDLETITQSLATVDIQSLQKVELKISVS